MEKTLLSLGFGISGDEVTIPSWRADVRHYSDLAEEIARFYGYNEIEPTMFKGELAALTGGLTDEQRLRRYVGEIVRGLGYSEICTYSFVGTSDYDKIAMPGDAEERRSVRILNPLGEDKAIMRTTPMPSMLEALSRNRGHRNENARLYELASIYRPRSGETLPKEHSVLILGAYGNTDFFTLKGETEAVLNMLRVPNVRFAADTSVKSLHPGQSALIYSGDEVIGCLGQIHPLVAKDYGLPEAYVSELAFETILEVREAERTYRQLPRFPSIERDLAVVCRNEIPVASLSDCILKSGGKLLTEAVLFDVYTGAQVPEGKKSVAFSLKLRADDRTLTDEEADEVLAGVLKALEDEFGAVIR